jgi:hypothetical protein
MAQVVKCSPSKCKVPSSNPSTAHPLQKKNTSGLSHRVRSSSRDVRLIISGRGSFFRELMVMWELWSLVEFSTSILDGAHFHRADHCVLHSSAFSPQHHSHTHIPLCPHEKEGRKKDWLIRWLCENLHMTYGHAQLDIRGLLPMCISTAVWKGWG